uniref:Uncharacterized protein n=1 Tax=Romanomermis culicivorax TaxID=13658 RepID=A0A915KQD4_ROMCU
FLVNESTIRIKTLIEGWIWKGFLGGSYAQNVLHFFNRTLGKKRRGSFLSEMSGPNNRVSLTIPENDDLRNFVVYNNRKNFNKELASEIAQFSTKYERCRSMIEPA